MTAIDNTTVTRGNYSALSEKLYGSRLSSVKVEYERDGETKVVEPLLGFSIPSVVGNLSGNVGYVRITGFYKNTAAEFKEAVAKLREQGAESIIFDVRNTSKGSIDYAAQVIDVIVPAISDNIAVAKDKNGNVYKNKVYTAENSSVTMPFAVLINSYTAGPAELFACDLRDISQAQIIGTASAGVGTMQELFALEDGGAVLLTVALVEPRGGEQAVYDKVGITPTVEVTLASGDDSNLLLLTGEQDNQLSTAMNMRAAESFRRSSATLPRITTGSEATSSLEKIIGSYAEFSDTSTMLVSFFITFFTTASSPLTSTTAISPLSTSGWRRTMTVSPG